MLVNHHTLPNGFILKEIVQWSDLNEENKDIGCCEIVKHSRISSFSEKLFNDLIPMKRKTTSDVGQSSNIGECDDAAGNCLMLWSRRREKGHRMLVNHQTLANAMMLREIVQWSDLNEAKKDIRCWLIIKHWRMWSCSGKLFNDLISMKRKKTYHVGQLSNIGECSNDKRNCSMIWSRWREKRDRMLVNRQTLANTMMLREIVQWSDLD